jgi:L-fucose isomerase-like protein
VYAASTLEWDAVEAGMRMVRAKRMFEESRILWIRADQSNETVLERLGTKVRAIPRKTFNELFDRMSETEEVRQVAEAMRRGAKKVVEPTPKDTLNAARVYTTAKRLLREQQSNALSMDCLGMVGAKLVPTPPCMAWSILQDQGITAGCEADLFGAVSLMLTSYLLGRPGFINDPVAETAKNLFIAAHCTCGSRLRGFDKPPVPYILRNHSESALGVSMEVLWPPGEPVTLVRFTNPNEMIVDTGTVVSNVLTPPAGGCRTSFEIKMDDMEDARDVKGFHQVVVLGNHRREVEGFCQLYGIGTIHSPEKAPTEERG